MWHLPPLSCLSLQYNMWCGSDPATPGTQEVFDLDLDPWEEHNSINDPHGANFSTANGPLAEFLYNCSGAECNSPQPLPVQRFECYKTTGPLDEFDP